MDGQHTGEHPEGELAEFICRPRGPALQSLFALLVPHRYIRLHGPAVMS